MAETESKVSDVSVCVTDLERSALRVDERHAGTAVDKKEMQMLGRVQELRRDFKFLPVLGFGCTQIGTWQFFLGIVQFGLLDGGTGGLIYAYILSLGGFACVYLSIAEMASMAPTSGGQYHWVSEFAPAKIQKYLSYLSGWFVFLAWQFSIVATSFLSGTIIQGLIVLNNSHYSIERWQGTLLVWAVAAFCIIFNVFLARKLAFVEAILLVIYIIGFFAIIIPLWVLAPRASSRAVFTQFNNGGGWSTVGTAVVIGMPNTMGSLIGFDCAVHMAEEIHDASRTLPLAIMWGVGVNGIMGLVMLITLCYTVGNVQEILKTPTGFPFIQVFYNTTQSLPAANFMTSIIVIVMISSVISEVATSSRQLWSFSRDGGFPFASYIAQIHKTKKIPLHAIMVSLIVTCLVSLINIGSTVALQAINSIGTSSQLASYMLTIACLLLKRIRGEPLPIARFSLGRPVGIAVNIAALVFLLPIFIFAFFPLTSHVTANTMNWNIVVTALLFIVSTVYYYVGGRKRYVPPATLVHRGPDEYDAKA